MRVSTAAVLCFESQGQYAWGLGGEHDVEILGDPYLRHVPLPRIPNCREPSLGTEPLPWTPNYCVANTAMSKPSQPDFLNGATLFSTAQHQ